MDADEPEPKPDSNRPVPVSVKPAALQAAAGAVLAFFACTYGGPYRVFEIYAFLAWAAIGLTAVAVCLVSALRDAACRRPALATAALVSIVLAGSPLWWPITRDLGWRTNVRATLAWNRSRYETIAAEVGKGARKGEERGTTRDGIRYVVDARPTLRIAFPIGDGILDNWTAIVRDPSGELGKLQRMNRPFEGPGDPLQMLFGGFIVYVRDLGGGYFYCAFT